MFFLRERKEEKRLNTLLSRMLLIRTSSPVGFQIAIDRKREQVASFILSHNSNPHHREYCCHSLSFQSAAMWVCENVVHSSRIQIVSTPRVMCRGFYQMENYGVFFIVFLAAPPLQIPTAKYKWHEQAVFIWFIARLKTGKREYKIECAFSLVYAVLCGTAIEHATYMSVCCSTLLDMAWVYPIPYCNVGTYTQHYQFITHIHRMPISHL